MEIENYIYGARGVVVRTGVCGTPRAGSIPVGHPNVLKITLMPMEETSLFVGCFFKNKKSVDAVM